MNHLIILPILFFSSLAFAYRQTDEVIITLNECLWNQKVASMEADCNDLFHHYLPLSSQYKPDSDVRLGSYNIFRLSEQQFKRLDLTAEMIDQSWDIVALSEVQPNRSDNLQFNVNALIALKNGKINESTFKEVYAKPSYLLLLEELQKLDKSWGLIISPFSQGTDSEVFAFLYRSNKAQPIESEYCKSNYLDNPEFQKLNVYREYRATNNVKDGGTSSVGGKEAYERDFVKPKKAIACTLAPTGLGLERFSKIPLTARFQSGKFDFSYITLHLRFRADGTVLNKCEAECQKIAADMLIDLELPRDEFKKIAGDTSGSEISNNDAREIARFFEAATAVREAVKIKAAENDKDVIVAGDYNLDYEPEGKWAALWEVIHKLQKGSEVLVTTKTSISNKEGLSNNYDHFILVPEKGSTDECDVDTAHPINFLDSNFILASKLEKYLNPVNFDDLIEKYRSEVSKTKVIDSKGKLVSFEDFDGVDGLSSEFKSRYDICRLDDPVYDVTCSKPMGIENQVRRQGEGLYICNKGQWVSEAESGKDLEKVKDLKMESVFLNPVDGLINNLECQVLYHSAMLEEDLLEKLHPRHAARVTFDGPLLKSGAVPGGEIYKPYTVLMSDHVPISMTCSTQKGDN